MGNCLNIVDNHKSSIALSRPEIYEKDELCPTYIQKSTLLRESPGIIREESDGEYSSPRFDEIKFQKTTSSTDQYPLGQRINSHTRIKLLNLHTDHYLHSHHIKHEHNKLYEVSCCSNCQNNYDWWQIKFHHDHIYIYHPLTQSYLISLPINGNALTEVACAINPQRWHFEPDQILCLNSIIKLRHCNGLVLHTQATESKVEGQHIVGLCNEGNDLWRIADIS